MTPDLSDIEKMARVGRLAVLRKARRETAQKLRDSLLPMLNSIEREGDAWDVAGIVDLVEQIKQLNQVISEQ
jgi:hypothetical protein